MDRQLAERMVGAACLLAVLVLVVPAILDGNPDSGATITHPPVDDSLDLRTHTIRLDGTEREPPVPTPRQPAPVAAVPAPPEPVPAESQPAAPTGSPGAPPAEGSPGGTGVGTGVPKERVAAAGTPAPRGALVPGGTAAVAPGPDAPAHEAAPSPASGDWIVQLGSFSVRENADRLAADLQRKGFSASVKGGGGSSGTLFRVRAGPVADRPAADALAGRLAAAGFKDGHVARE